MLSSKTLVLTHSLCDSSHYLSPNSQSVPSPTPSFLATTSLFSKNIDTFDWFSFKNKVRVIISLNLWQALCKERFSHRERNQELKTFRKETSKYRVSTGQGFSLICITVKKNTVIISGARHCQLAEEFYWPNINMFKTGWNRNWPILVLPLLLGQSVFTLNLNVNCSGEEVNSANLAECQYYC